MAAAVDSHAINLASWDREDGYDQIKGELDHLAACLGTLLTQIGARLAQDRRWLRDEKNKVLEEQDKLAQNPLSQPAAAGGLEDPLATIMRSWQQHESNDAEKQEPAAPNYVPFSTSAHSESSAHRTLEQPREAEEEDEADEVTEAAEWMDNAKIAPMPDLSGPPGIDSCNALDSDVSSSAQAVAREASKAAPTSNRPSGEHRGMQIGSGQSTQGSSSAAAMQPAPASQPEHVLRSQEKSTSEVKKLLDDTWEGSKGETYTLEMPGHSNWRCYRYDKEGENKFKLFLDLEHFRVWWSWSFFLDLKEFSSAPNTACWYSANDNFKTRPCFVWRRVRPLQM